MKKSKKLLISVFALVVTLALATSATFAWFSLNDKVTVGSFDVSATTGSDGLYISYGIAKSDSVFGSKVESDTIKNDDKIWVTDGAEQNPKVLGYTAMTSDDGIAFKDINDTAKQPNEAYTPGKDATFLQFNLSFRSTTPMKVYLYAEGGASAVTAAEGREGIEVAWPGYVATNYYDNTDGATVPSDIAAAEGSKLNARAANAARISFVTNTVDRTTPETPTLTAGTAKIWNPNPKKGYYKGNMASDFNRYNDSATAAVTEKVLGDKAVVAYTTATADSATPIATTAQAEYIKDTKTPYEAVITINIWLEGTDGDCMNDLFSDIFNVKLAFFGKAAA